MKIIRSGSSTKIYQQKQKLKLLRKYLLRELPLLLLALLITNNYFYFLVKVEEKAMLPTIKKGETVLFNKYRYGLAKPFSFDKPDNRFRKRKLQRGDVIAMQIPDTKPASFFCHLLDIPLSIITLGVVDLVPRKIIVRRLIALPGDTIEIKNKKIFLNHKPLEPKWDTIISPKHNVPDFISHRDNMAVTFIPSGKAFVINDNWSYLNDSRSFGLIDIYKIEGRLNRQP